MDVWEMINVMLVCDINSTLLLFTILAYVQYVYTVLIYYFLF